MIVLGIETSGPVGSIALRRGGRCVEERFLPELGRRHAQSLVPEVVDFLRRHGTESSSIDAVAVSVGPGSFTGLRVGVTFAKSFAYTTGATLVAVETFQAIAANAPSAPKVTVVADAQRRGVMIGEYVRDLDGSLRRSGDIRIVLPEEISRQPTLGGLWTGPGLDRLTGMNRSTFEMTVPTLRWPRASSIAALGEQQAHRGETADASALEPLYIRRSAAEEKREQVGEHP